MFLDPWCIIIFMIFTISKNQKFHRQRPSVAIKKSRFGRWRRCAAISFGILIQWCEALSFRFRPGAPFGQNRGVLLRVWPGPLWTKVSPIRINHVEKSLTLITIILDDLSNGACDFSVRTRDMSRFAPTWAFFHTKN